MKKFILLIFSIFSFLYSRSQSPDQIGINVNAEAAKFMEAKGAVGLAIGIYKNGRAHVYTYGTADKEKSGKPTAGSIFNIASLSKTFTGLVLAQAVIEKKVSTEDDVRKYLVGDYRNLEYNGQPIRLGHLISHLSRLPAFLSTRADSSGYTKADFFADLHNATLDTIPGIRFKYSNAGVQLLGYILEDVYKSPLEKLLSEKITRDLGMHHTTLVLKKSDRKLKTRGYNKDGSNNEESYDRLLGAGGMKSSVEDILKYVAFQIKEGDESLRLSHREIWGFDMGDGKHYSFGMGWQVVTNQKGVRKISQDGNLPSYSSVMMFSPELGTGIVVLSNSFMMEEAGALANNVLSELEPEL